MIPTPSNTHCNSGERSLKSKAAKNEELMASPMTLYGPKVADWGQRGCFRDRRFDTKSRFAGDGCV